MTGKTTKVRSLFLTALMVMSVFAGATAFAGSAGAANEVSLDTPDRYWSGETLTFTVSEASDGSAFSDNVVDLYAVDGDELIFEGEVFVNANGEGELETSDLDGKYVITYKGTEKQITFEGGSGVAYDANATDSAADNPEFTIRSQDFNASFADDEANDGAPGETTEVKFDSNRGSFNVEVTADGLNTEDLNGIFANAPNLADTEDGVEFTANTSAGTVANFSGVTPGDYDFTFAVDGSDIEVTDNITVNDRGDAYAEFSESRYETQRGDIAKITVDMENTRDAHVKIGDKEDDGYQLEFDVHDENEDGEVTVFLNTFRTHNIDGQNGADADQSTQVGAIETATDTYVYTASDSKDTVKQPKSVYSPLRASRGR